MERVYEMIIQAAILRSGFEHTWDDNPHRSKSRPYSMDNTQSCVQSGHEARWTRSWSETFSETVMRSDKTIYVREDHVD